MFTYNRGIAAVAIACFIGAFALTPSEVRSRLGPVDDATAMRTPAEPAAVAAIVPTGDPFVPRAVDPAPVVAGRRPPVGDLALPALAGIGPLPANAGAGMLPLDVPGGPLTYVSATIVGTHASALVVEGRITRLVSVGDRFAGARIRAIAADGVTLDDGRRSTLRSDRPAAR